MNPKAGLRPGGRSARVQAAVHQAVRDLIAEQGRSALTVPLIAARAGVTPSTLYRRWGELADLLADVALDQWRADAEPAETGSLLGDLMAWAEQYLEEMSSEPGRAMMRDVLAGQSRATPAPSSQCAAYLQSQLDLILQCGGAHHLSGPVRPRATQPCAVEGLGAGLPGQRSAMSRARPAAAPGLAQGGLVFSPRPRHYHCAIHDEPPGPHASPC